MCDEALRCEWFWSQSQIWCPVFFSQTFGQGRLVAMYAPNEPVVDYNMVIIFLMAVGTVAVGGHWAGSKDRKKWELDTETWTHSLVDIFEHSKPLCSGYSVDVVIYIYIPKRNKEDKVRFFFIHSRHTSEPAELTLVKKEIPSFSINLHINYHKPLWQNLHFTTSDIA